MTIEVKTIHVPVNKTVQLFTQEGSILLSFYCNFIMDVMQKMTFCVFIGHERQKLFWGIIIFIRRVPPSNFVVVTFLLTSLRKCYFLRRLLKRYRLLMAEIALLMFVFYIRLQASSRISMRIWWICVWWIGIILTVLC